MDCEGQGAGLPLVPLLRSQPTPQHSSSTAGPQALVPQGATCLYPTTLTCNLSLLPETGRTGARRCSARQRTAGASPATVRQQRALPPPALAPESRLHFPRRAVCAALRKQLLRAAEMAAGDIAVRPPPPFFLICLPRRRARRPPGS